MMDRTGQQLGNYRLTRLLGKGGFAEVYLGEHVVLRTMVAIKILHTRVTEADVEQWPNILSSLASSLKLRPISDHHQSGISEET